MAAIAVGVISAGCGGQSLRPATPRARAVVQMEELRITARRSDNGYDFETYDAEGLFRSGTTRLSAGHCAEAVQLYDRLVTEFAASRYVSAALYNAGLCLQEAGESAPAADHYERLLVMRPQSPDVKHASFQLAALLVALERWERAEEVGDQLLRREDLTADERVEAIARRAQALLGRGLLDEAGREARGALRYTSSRSPGDPVRDNTFVATANFVLAESMRLQAAAIEIPLADLEQQRSVLERRAQLVLDAQREYFNTIGHTNPEWAAAAGYRIGTMYDAFWQAIMAAPVAEPQRPLSAEGRRHFDQEYRRRLAELIEPLTRHAIRYWELTLMMIERTGVQSEWTVRVRADLERARNRLLNGSPGAGAEAVQDHAPARQASDSTGPSSPPPGADGLTRPTTTASPRGSPAQL